MTKHAWGLTASFAVICGVLAGVPAWAQSTNLGIEVLSSRPDQVTGGDALVKILGAAAAPNVTVGGKDVSAAFKSDAHEPLVLGRTRIANLRE